MGKACNDPIHWIAGACEVAGPARQCVCEARKYMPCMLENHDKHKALAADIDAIEANGTAEATESLHRICGSFLGIEPLMRPGFTTREKTALCVKLSTQLKGIDVDGSDFVGTTSTDTVSTLLQLATAAMELDPENAIFSSRAVDLRKVQQSLGARSLKTDLIAAAMVSAKSLYDPKHITYYVCQEMGHRGLDTIS